MRSNVFEGGKLEIQCFLPEILLKEIDFETISTETFFGYLAQARYIEEIKRNITRDALAEIINEMHE